MTELDYRTLHRRMLALAREDFGLFAIAAFRRLHDEPYQDNWHVWAIAHQLMRLFKGDIRRLIITMPPRTMKSFLASVCLPAWLLGRAPGAKIICASYAQPLSSNFAFQMRRLMETPWYRELFPRTLIDPKKSGVEEIATARGGYRLATSVGGTLTGRGADYIIIDDPLKAGDACSEVAREGVVNWYKGTVSSRFNNPSKGRVVVVAQRLHLEDLPGQLTAGGGWEQLDLPLEAWREQEIELLPGQVITRPPGNVLHEARFGEDAIARLRSEMGERDFEAQYNQRPLPAGGALFQLKWLQRYDEPPAPRQVQGIFQSWDTAYEIADGNDYSVCTTWALSGTRYYLLDVYRARLPFPDLQNAVYRLREVWKADLVIVERAGSGISLHQNIYDPSTRAWIQAIKPEGSKQDRASQQSPKFERGEIWMPRNAPWLQAFEDELASFPHGKHDDQIDSVVQFLAAVDTGRLLIAADQAKRR